MPTFMAMVVASLVAWLVKDGLPAPAGNLIPTFLAMLTWLFAFYFTKRYFDQIRPGS